MKSTPSNPVPRGRSLLLPSRWQAPLWVRWSAIGLLAFGLAQCGPTHAATNDEAPQAARPIPVPTLVLEDAQIHSVQRHFTGVLQARREVAVGVQVAGRIVALEVETGQAVAQGEALLRLDDRRLQSAKRTLTAQIAAAEADLARLREGPRRETIDAARAQVQALEEELALAEIRLARREELLAAASTSEEDVDVGRAQVKTLQARLAGSQAQWQELVNGTRPEILLAAEANLDALRSQADSLEIDLADTLVTAPFAGRVQRILAREGAVVPAGMGVIELVEDGVLEAHVGLPLVDSQFLDPKSVRLTANGQPLDVGAVRTLPTIDDTYRTVAWIFEVQPTADLRPGSTVRLHLEEPLERAGWSLPLSAITEGVRGMWSGYVIESDETGPRLRSVDLEVLHTTPDAVIVHGALRAGDRVLTEGLDRVVPGQRVDLGVDGPTRE